MPVGKRIFLQRELPDPAVVEGFKTIPAANVADVMNRSCAMNPRIRLVSKPAAPIMKNFASPCRKLGLYFDNVKRVVLRDMTLLGAEGPPLITRHCGEVVAENFRSEE